MTVETITLPANVRRITVPIKLPPRRNRESNYVGILLQVASDKKTSEETGLCPRLEWNCDDAHSLRNVYSSLIAARRRRKLDGVGIRSLSDKERNRYIVYVWNQE